MMLEDVAKQSGELLNAQGAYVATAESCTGGLIAHALTQIPGSSAYVKGGLCAYQPEVKVDLLGVDPEVIAAFGVVSEPVAKQMAEGARRLFACEWAVSTTGVAGPSGGSAETPVGLVFYAVAGADGVTVKRGRFEGGRAQIKSAAAQAALEALVERLRWKSPHV